MTKNASGLSTLSVLKALNATNTDDLLLAKLEAESFNGGEGNDTVSYVNSTAAVTASLAGVASANIGGFAAGDSFSSIENLTGSRFNDRLTGNAEANVLDGGAGADILTGGAGHDTYIVDNARDQLIERANEGNDTVKSTITWTLGAHLENLTLAGAGNINGTGNGLDNVITGNAGRNTLTGNAGNDTLDGGAGADILVGGAGNDIYVVDNAGDRVTEAARAGIDTVRSSVTYTLGANVENLVLTGMADINGTGNALDNVLTGNEGNNRLTGGAGNDTYIVNNTGDNVVELARGGTDVVQSSVSWMLGAHVENLILVGNAAINGTGNELDNSITGNNADNELNGEAGNDKISGERGDDTLMGGAGNDTLDGGEGWDHLYGEAGNDTLRGGAASDELFGGEGLDTLSGGAGDDTLYGGEGNDILDGGAGGDSMQGGQGNDIYIVTSERDTVSDEEDGGVDTVRSTVGFDLSENVENLELLGEDDIDGTGNDLGNIIRGNDGANAIEGGGGDDSLYGGDGDDTLSDSSGANSLYGGSGQDSFILDGDDRDGKHTVYGGEGDDRIHAEGGGGTLHGGAGNDEYNITGNYVIIEEADGGVDVVRSFETHVLGEHVEQLYLQGSANIDGTGNALDNEIGGNPGNNQLFGGEGNDTAYLQFTMDSFVFSWNAETQRLTITGPEGTDVLEGFEVLKFSDQIYTGDFAALTTRGAKIEGTDESDVLNGGAGNDTLTGGKGDDTLNGGGGNDTAVFSGALTNYSLSIVDGKLVVHDNRLDGDGTDILNEMETIRFNGEDHGFSFASGMIRLSTPSATILLGTSGDDVISVTEGTSIQMQGGNGNDRLEISGGTGHVAYGGAGNDTLQLSASGNSAAGGEGDDNYLVSTLNITITEDANGGTDHVETSVDWTLGEHFENLTLGVFSTNGNGTGNSLDNVIIGNAGDNKLDGMAGNDTLTGGAGDDTLIGGQGNDTAVFSGTQASYSFSWNAATSTLTVTGVDGTDRLMGIENLRFADGLYSGDLAALDPSAPKILTGGDGNDTLTGGAGNDTLNGGNGNDILEGGAGNDALDGGAGDDHLFGGEGDDILNGGIGIDTVTFSEARANYLINEWHITGAGSGTDALLSIERLVFSDGTYVLDGSGGWTILI